MGGQSKFCKELGLRQKNIIRIITSTKNSGT